MTQTPEPYALAGQAAAEIRALIDGAPVDLALVLGSGWAEAADSLGTVIAGCELAQLTGFRAPSVVGHGGRLRLIRTERGRTAAVFTGRTHYYEGFGVEAVVHGVRTAAAAGADTVVLTNGCGSINSAWPPGTPVLISDHINFTGTTPLIGPRFVDMTKAYSPRLRGLAREVSPELPEGVYIQFCGPQYETPAEITMAAAWGADLVGMSTVLETIAAVEAGLEVLGLSLVTNLAAGMSGDSLSHSEVVEAGAAATPHLRELLRQLGGVL